MSDFLSFRRMITPMFIQVIFWIFVAISVLIGLGLIIGGSTGGEQLFGFLYLILGPLIARVYCEIVIIFFRMNESLTDIRERVGPAQSSTPPLPLGEGS